MPSGVEWVEISLEVPAEAAEAAAAALWEAGAAGVAMREPGREPVGLYDFAEGSSDGPAVVSAYFAAETASEIRKALQPAEDRIAGFFGFCRERHRTIAEAEWADRWREFYHPFRVGGLWIAPPWERPEAERVLVLDPGGAFGTGLHPTTRLMLRHLRREVRPGSTVLDLGTGSGILGLAALFFGAGRSVGVDLDPTAVRVARENARRNGLEDRFEVRLGDITAVKGPFDVIVANITAAVLRDYLPHFAGLLPPGGVLLLSGILADGALEWRSRLAGNGLRPAGRRRLGDWLALRAERPRA